MSNEDPLRVRLHGAAAMIHDVAHNLAEQAAAFRKIGMHEMASDLKASAECLHEAAGEVTQAYSDDLQVEYNKTMANIGGTLSMLVDNATRVQ